VCRDLRVRPRVVRRRCVFELFIASTTKGCTYDLIMPPREGERFLKTLVADFDSIATALSKVWSVVVPYPHCPTNTALRWARARTRSCTCTRALKQAHARFHTDAPTRIHARTHTRT
jgi:hypothetical protein